MGQAGPYYVTGQSLLVAKDDNSIKGPDDLKGKKVCSVTGSTSIATVEEKYGAKPAGFDTYSECVDQLKNGSVDAVTTDGAILLGYAAEDPDALKVVGEPFSEERYGIGYNKDQPELCEFLNETITTSFEDGSFEKAFDATLGKSGNERAGGTRAGSLRGLIRMMSCRARDAAGPARHPHCWEEVPMDALTENWDLILKGFWETIKLLLVSGGIALVLGTARRRRAGEPGVDPAQRPRSAT